MATHLIDRFGSIARIASASIKDLMEMPGVGKKRAVAIAEVMQTAFTKSQA